MSIPPTAGLNRSVQDLSTDWIVANLDAAAAAFVLGLAAYGVRQLLGMPDPNAGSVVWAVQAAVEIAAAAAAFAVYAIRTGAVLRQKLPDFPSLTWNVLHVVMGIGVGVVVAAMAISAETAPREGPTVSLVASMAIGGIIAGAFLGAVWGALQALVLRQAAREVGFWINWSVLAGTTFGGYALVLYLGADQTFANESLTQFLSSAITLAAGVVMLPALHRLRPR